MVGWLNTSSTNPDEKPYDVTMMADNNSSTKVHKELSFLTDKYGLDLEQNIFKQDVFILLFTDVYTLWTKNKTLLTNVILKG